MRSKLFQKFNSNISSLELPGKFTYPFNYTPHILAQTASEQLQDYLTSHPEFFQHLGSKGFSNETNVGKMFGVLVVQDNNGDLGFLCGFSGKLSDTSDEPLFVPPVVNLLVNGGLFKSQENEIISTNQILDI